jgi:hypothetical protein
MVNARDDYPEPLIVPLSIDGSEALTFDVGGISGWGAFHSKTTQEHQVFALLRVGPETSEPDSPLEVRELRVALGTAGERGDLRDAGDGFTSALLRTIPFGRIVAAINRPAIAAELRPLLPPANFVWDGAFPGSKAWTYVLPPSRKVTLRPKLRVKDPGTRRKPDEFYRNVAELFLAQASISDRAAKDLAEANDLPPTTVHRWLKEARVRGVLRMPRQQGGE